MNGVSPGFYARVRTWADGDGRVREDTSPPERWMQQIWRHQRIHRGQLRTLDGETVRILHPGFWNREAGPDFRDAVVQIGTGPARRGDVELDRAVDGWRSHRHEGNPRYLGVILHVVWTAPAAVVSPPVLLLKPYLDAPLAELATWLESEAPGLLPGNLPGTCCAPLRDLAPEQFRELLHQAARIRLQRKASEFAARARQAGWEQALWEGVFTALGYKHNGWPMRRLAELVVPDDSHAFHGSDPVPTDSERIPVLEWEARLLGLSGLLPPQLPSGAARGVVRRLWDLWWRERDAWGEQVLPPFVWRLSGVRPANHPQRRIILAARLRAHGGLSGALQAWLTGRPGRMESVAELHQILSPPAEPEDYWLRHATLRSLTSRDPMPLLGLARLTELAMNAVLPWLLARALAGGREDLPGEIEKRYFAWPAADDNAGLRLARQRLLGDSVQPVPWTGAMQQGLHQILCDFCLRSGPLCEACQFPAAIRSLG